MSRGSWSRRWWASCILLLCSLMLPGLVSPASAQGTGVVRGTVRAAQAEAPLPYAVVSIPALNIERFSDPQGRFILTGVRAGTHDVVVRRIGYRPFRGQVRVDSGATATLAVTLQQSPYLLASTTVTALASCPRPGPPDARKEAALFALFDLVRENAQRYRLLAKDYPFIYLQVRATGELGPKQLFVSRVDTLLVRSTTRTEYAPGRVVARRPDGRGGNEYTMLIPTLIDLADDVFVRNHCFAHGGTVRDGDETWVRLDVRAADRLSTPDVHGSFYVDSATAQLRRMSLTLSRPDRLPESLRGVKGVDMVTAFREIADGIAVIDKVCAINRLRFVENRSEPMLPAELQQLLVYEFSEPPPDVDKRGAMLPPNAWQSTARLPRSDVWCAGG